MMPAEVAEPRTGEGKLLASCAKVEPAAVAVLAAARLPRRAAQARVEVEVAPAAEVAPSP